MNRDVSAFVRILVNESVTDVLARNRKTGKETDHDPGTDLPIPSTFKMSGSSSWNTLCHHRFGTLSVLLHIVKEFPLILLAEEQQSHSSGNLLTSSWQ
jgi:hypothetical protein